MTTAPVEMIAERYEELRLAVVTDRAIGERRGLALFVRDGMAAWLQAWTSVAQPRATNISTEGAAHHDRSAIDASSAIASLLASMALSTLQERPS